MTAYGPKGRGLQRAHRYYGRVCVRCSLRRGVRRGALSV